MKRGATMLAVALLCGACRGTGIGTNPCADGGCREPPSTAAACAARGGACRLLGAPGDPCPAGEWSVFSGAGAFCDDQVLQRCCAPLGIPTAPCDQLNPCDDGGCLLEQSGYPPGGFCAAGVCDPAAPDNGGCAPWATCLPVYFSAALGMCLVTCASDDWCREGWSCQAFPVDPFGGSGETTWVCWEDDNGFQQGVGAPCVDANACFSMRCETDPRGGAARCTATCDDANPCAGGFTCVPAAGCSTPGCGLCFP